MPEEAFFLLPGTLRMPFVPQMPMVGTLRGSFVPEEAFFFLPGTFGADFVPEEAFFLPLGTFRRVFVTNACKKSMFVTFM